jgi:uncharacterized membrane protein
MTATGTDPDGAGSGSDRAQDGDPSTVGGSVGTRDWWLFSENRRMFIAAIVSILVTVATTIGVEDARGPWASTLVTWNALAATYVGLSWVLFLRAGPEQVQRWAVRRDRPVQGLLHRWLYGRSATTSLWLIGLGSFYGVASAGYVLPRVGRIEPDGQDLLTGLGVAAIAASWFAAHTGYALHYAFQYHRVGGRGLEFVGDEQPNLLDFAYFSFGVGKTFGATDVAVSTRTMRRTVLLHGLYAFVFNSAILAVALSYIASR